MLRITRERLGVLLAATTLSCARPQREAARQSERRDALVYPARFAPMPAASIAARERAFRVRNPEPWIRVEFDRYGLLARAIIELPLPPRGSEPPPRDDAALRVQWRAFLLRNADDLGLDAWGMHEVASTDGTMIAFLQRLGSYTLGSVSVSWRGPFSLSSDPCCGGVHPGTIEVGGHGWRGVARVPRERTDDELAQRFVGTPGVVTVHFEPHADPPCDPPPRCLARPPLPALAPWREKHTLARNELRFEREGVCRYRRRDSETMDLRVIARPHLYVAATGGPSPTSYNRLSIFEPAATHSLAERLDAITGEDLSEGTCEM